MNVQLYAPVVLFVYKRPELTKLTVESLLKNREAPDSDLIIYSDAPKTEKDRKPVDEVRSFLKTISGFKSVTVNEGSANKGLAASIITGVTEVVNKYGRIIVLEDDMLVSPYFLKYMNDALDLYETDEDVVSIHGYMYPVEGKLPEIFFLKGADCWGWATWKRGWNVFNPDPVWLYKELVKKNLGLEFDFGGTARYMRMLRNQVNGKIDSWAIRWHASAFLAGKYTLYPGRPFVRNIGAGEGATHTKTMDIYYVHLAEKPVNIKKIKVEELPEVKAMVRQFFKKVNPGIFFRVMQKLKLK
jgi:hypothetical protein